MNQDAFIDQLASDLQKIPTQAPPLRSIGLMLLCSLGAGLALISVCHVRPDIQEASGHGSYVWEFMLVIVFAIAAYAMAVRSLVPGLIQKPTRLWLVLGLMLVSLLQSLWQHPYETVTAGFWRGLHCTFLIAINGLLPAIFAIRTMRRGAPTRPRLSMALALCGSFGVAIAVQQLVCGKDETWHLISWHLGILPLAFIAANSLGRRVLGW